MYPIVVFNSGSDGYARGGGEFTLIRVPINWWARKVVGNWFLHQGKTN